MHREPMWGRVSTYFGACVIVLLSLAAGLRAGGRQTRLHATIESWRYCQVDSEVSALRIRFKVRLENTGRANLIIPEEITPLLWVSRTLADVKQHKHEFEIHLPDTFRPQADALPRKKSRSRVVHTDEVVEADTAEVVLPIARRADVSELEALAPGTHYLQVIVPAQIEDTTTFVDMISQPITFAVERHPPPLKCE